MSKKSVILPGVLLALTAVVPGRADLSQIYSAPMLAPSVSPSMTPSPSVSPTPSTSVSPSPTFASTPATPGPTLAPTATPTSQPATWTYFQSEPFRWQVDSTREVWFTVRAENGLPAYCSFQYKVWKVVMAGQMPAQYICAPDERAARAGIELLIPQPSIPEPLVSHADLMADLWNQITIDPFGHFDPATLAGLNPNSLLQTSCDPLTRRLPDNIQGRIQNTVTDTAPDQETTSSGGYALDPVQVTPMGVCVPPLAQ